MKPGKFGINCISSNENGGNLGLIARGLTVIVRAKRGLLQLAGGQLSQTCPTLYTITG